MNRLNIKYINVRVASKSTTAIVKVGMTKSTVVLVAQWHTNVCICAVLCNWNKAALKIAEVCGGRNSVSSMIIPIYRNRLELSSGGGICLRGSRMTSVLILLSFG